MDEKLKIFLTRHLYNIIKLHTLITNQRGGETMNKDTSMKKLYVIIAILIIVIVAGGVGVTVYVTTQNNLAKEAQRQAAQEKKEQEEALYNQGKALCDTGKYEEAITMLAQYSNVQKISDLINTCYLKWGQSLSNSGKYTDAINCYKNYTGNDQQTLISQCEEKIKLAEEAKKKAEEAKKKAEQIEKNRLVVGYNVYQSTDDEKGIFHKNGEGKIVLLSDIPLDDWVGGGGKYVTYTMPQSSINFKLSNIGEKALKDVKFIISFDGMYIKNLLDCPGFTEQEHVNGIGGLVSAIKTIDKIQGGMAVNFSFSMHEAYSFNGSNGGKMKITVSADDYQPHTYSIPVRIK